MKILVSELAILFVGLFFGLAAITLFFKLFRFLVENNLIKI